MCNMSHLDLEALVGLKCVGCGSCIAACPLAAITVEPSDGLLRPTIDKARCSRCDLCAKNCPVIRKMFTDPPVSDVSRIIGRPLNAYSGYASEPAIRLEGASGGVTTAILKALLDEKEIDYIVTAHQNRLVARPIKIYESEDLLTVQGSIYFPSFVTQATKEILASPENCAVVGLPCQIESFRRLEAASKRLNERIRIHLGLFCSHTNEYWYLSYLSSHYRGLGCDPLTASPRHGAWPGNVELKTSCGDISIPQPAFWGALPQLHLTTPTGCLFCDNHMNIHSDIALGDAWLRQDRKDVGRSTVVAYSQRGLDAAETARRKRQIVLEEISLQTLIECQLGNVVSKFVGVPLRRRLIRRSSMVDILRRHTVDELLISILPLLNSHLGQRSALRRMLCKPGTLEKPLHLYQVLMQKMLLKATSRIKADLLHHGAEAVQNPPLP